MADARFDPDSSELSHTLAKLHGLLETIPKDVIDKSFAEYVFFPLSHLLKKPRLGDRVSEELLRILTVLVGSGAWSDPKMLEQIMVLCTLLTGKHWRETSAAGCAALVKVFELLPQQSFASPNTGQTLTVLLDAAVLGIGNLEVQNNALDALIVYIERYDQLNDVVPGFVSAITKILQGFKKEKRHYTVIVRALNLLRMLLGKVLYDSNPNISSEWISATSSQVKMSLNWIPNIRKHSRPEVRSALKTFSLGMLRNCEKNLSNCVPIFLDTSLYLQEQTNQTELNVLVASSQPLSEALRERVFEWIESIPRLSKAQDETQAITILRLIKESVSILTKDAEFFGNLLLKTLSETSVLQTSSKVVPEVLTTSKELITIASGDLSNYEVSKEIFYQAGLDFVHPSVEAEIAETLKHIASLNGEGAFSGLDEIFMELQDTVSPSQKALMSWLAVNVMDGALTAKSEVDDWLVSDQDEKSQAKEDLALEMYSYCTNMLRNTTTSSVSTELQRYDDVTTAIALRGVSVLARYIGPEFRNELMDILYYVVEMLGSRSQVVREQARMTIMVISKACNYLTVRDLVVENADYITDTLSMKLATLNFSEQGPVNLGTLVKLSGTKIIPYLDDVVASLFNILDNYHGYASITSGIFEALDSIVEQVEVGYSQKLLEYKDPNQMARIESQFQYVKGFNDLLEILERKPDVPNFDGKPGSDFIPHDGKPFKSTTEVDSDDEDEEDYTQFKEKDVDPTTSLTTPEEDALSKWTSPVPKSVHSLVSNIFSYSVKFLTNPSATLRTKLLTQLKLSLPVLASNQETLLPLIADAWPSIIHILDDRDESVQVQRAARQLVAQLSIYSGDFLTTRIVDSWRLLLRDPEVVATVIKNTRLDKTVLFKILEHANGKEVILNAIAEVEPDGVWFERCKQSKKKITLPDFAKELGFLEFVI